MMNWWNSKYYCTSLRFAPFAPNPSAFGRHVVLVGSISSSCNDPMIHEFHRTLQVSHRKPELDERPRPLTPSLVRPRDNSPPKGCTISTAPNAGGAGSLPSTNVVRCGTSGGGSTGGVEPCVPIKEKVGLGGGGSGAIDSRGERNRSSGSSVPPGRPAGATVKKCSKFAIFQHHKKTLLSSIVLLRISTIISQCSGIFGATGFPRLA